MTKVLYVVIYLLGVFVSAVAQILLKKSTNKTYGSRIKEYLNPYVIVSYTIFFAATFCTVFAYAGIPLSFGPVLAASEYLFVTVLSRLFLKEKINLKKALGLTVIITGIIVYSL